MNASRDPNHDADVIVIGSGMGGLATAALLAHLHGRKVLVLERRVGPTHRCVPRGERDLHLGHRASEGHRCAEERGVAGRTPRRGPGETDRRWRASSRRRPRPPGTAPGCAAGGRRPTQCARSRSRCGPPGGSAPAASGTRPRRSASCRTGSRGLRRRRRGWRGRPRWGAPRAARGDRPPARPAGRTLPGAALRARRRAEASTPSAWKPARMAPRDEAGTTCIYFTARVARKQGRSRSMGPPSARPSS